MSKLNWGMIQDGGTFESLMHAILYAEDAGTILFGRPGRDAGQDACSEGGTTIYQAKYRNGLTMDSAICLAIRELVHIKEYRKPEHSNYKYWKDAINWVLFANIMINPNDDAKWKEKVVPIFKEIGLIADYLDIEKIEGKLTKLDSIREVFFCGENRVMVGLKEANDLLRTECIGSMSLEKPIIGRESEMQTIITFSESAEKRLLPIVGQGGIGKSRLLYESLVLLGQKGWRVFWALPGTMAISSRWFFLLNGNQPTCVAIDDPGDTELLRAVIEQLTAIERRNWKVIIACRSEKEKFLKRFLGNLQVSKPLRLKALGETASKQILKALLKNQYPESWLFNVYNYTHGVPGWLCLIAELTNQSSISHLSSNIDNIASAYVDSSLQSIDLSQREMGKILLQWLALWGIMNLDGNAETQEELRFLHEMGIPETNVREILQTFVNTGIVNNWGVGKRLYAIEPLIIREYIISDWLFKEDDGRYKVSSNGRVLVGQLIKNEIPSFEKILRTLLHLTRTRLDESAGFTFLKPIFDDMSIIAKDGDVLDQLRVLNLVERAGIADPESALEVLRIIGKSPKESIKVDESLWGSHTFTYPAILSKLVWITYEIAEYVDNVTVATRFLSEFRELITLEENSVFTSERGKGARELLQRLLHHSRNWELFAQPSYEILQKEISNTSMWSFVGILLGGLLDPEREFTEWTAKWTLSINRRAIAPDTNEWELAIKLRAEVFEILQTSAELDLRFRLWQVLAESHHQFKRILMHGHVIESYVSIYRSLLIDDLTKCIGCLQSPPVTLSIEEATSARDMWSWYIDYEQDEDILERARQCEDIYNSLSNWRLHEFFRFGNEEELLPEIERVAAVLRATSDIDTFYEFFTEAKRYLDAERRGGRDGMDWMHISVLADALIDLFNPSEIALPANILTFFVRITLEQTEEENILAWHFALRICQKYMRHIKDNGDLTLVNKELRKLLNITPSKAKFLLSLYSNAHKDSVGILTDNELDCIFEQESGFSVLKWFYLLGMFAMVRWDKIRYSLSEKLDTMRNQPIEASLAIKGFVSSLNLSVIRYKYHANQIPMAWIIDMITEFGLDGAILENYDLIWLRDQSGFKISMAKMLTFINSRIVIEKNQRPDNSYQIMPHDFHISEWCRFDESNTEEVCAFHELCNLSLGSGFTALYWIPKYLVQLNPSGEHVASFVEGYLSNNPTLNFNELKRLAYLASEYNDTTEAWAIIARPICQKAQELERTERERIYSGLSKKETGVLTSLPSEVPDFFFRVRNDAVRMNDAEPNNSFLKEYRKWALCRAEAALEYEKGRAAEESNDD